MNLHVDGPYRQIHDPLASVPHHMYYNYGNDLNNTGMPTNNVMDNLVQNGRCD